MKSAVRVYYVEDGGKTQIKLEERLKDDRFSQVVSLTGEVGWIKVFKDHLNPVAVIVFMRHEGTYFHLKVWDGRDMPETVMMNLEKLIEVKEVGAL